MAVTITIDGEGLSLKRETNLQKAGQIISFLGLDDSIPTAGTNTDQILTPIPMLGATSTSSLKDLITESKAKTNAQKITVVGSYSSDKDGQEGFLIKDVQFHLKKMGETPGNFTRDLKSATALKYVVEINSKEGRYMVTDRGKEAIQDRFTNEVKPKSPGKKSGGTFQKAIPPRDEVTSLSIVTNLEGYPDFHDLPTKADSILWVLAYGASKGVESLTPREVEFLSDRLLKKVEQKDFSAHNKRNRESSYVAFTDGKFKLQQKGIDYLIKVNEKKSEVKE